MHHAQPHAQNCTSALLLAKFALSSLLSVPVAHRSSALLQTYLWMVSSAWLAWSKCPPLHPCCHRGNQADQTTQSDGPRFCAGILWSISKSFLFFFFFLLNPCRWWCQICHGSATLLSGFWSLSSNTHRLLLRHSLCFCASHSSAAFYPPFPPCFLPSSCPRYCRLLVTKATLGNNTTDKWMTTDEGHAFKSVWHYLSFILCDTNLHLSLWGHCTDPPSTTIHHKT